MASSTPVTLRRFCRERLPLLLRRANGRRMLDDIRAVLETDRWVSFDRWLQTTRTLVRRYDRAGVRTEVHSIQTGGPVGSGRWIIPEAADVRKAVVDIVKPFRRRLLDWRDNPFHVVQWSGASPRQGMSCRLVVIDTLADLTHCGPTSLAGAMVLTRACSMAELFAKGAAGVIMDRPCSGLPDAVRWEKFGWGAIPISQPNQRPIGLVLSENQGRLLRREIQARGPLTIRVTVDIRHYVGRHEVVMGVMPGRDDPQDEVWALAHSLEPGALDNASGVAVCLEIARVIEGLIADGKLARPRRSIRLLSGYECYGFFHCMEHVPRLQSPLGGVVIDSVGIRPSLCNRLEWHATAPGSAAFVNRVGEAMLRAVLKNANPGYRLHLMPFLSTADTLAGDSKYGFPCLWVGTLDERPGIRVCYPGYHSSADTPAIMSTRGLRAVAAAMAGYLYYLADAGNEELLDLALAETNAAIRRLHASPRRREPGRVQCLLDQHHRSIESLKRWMWGGDRAEILARLEACERAVRANVRTGKPAKVSSRGMPAKAALVPRRTAFLVPTTENVSANIAGQLGRCGLPHWAAFWADGHRSLAEIARAIAIEEGRDVLIDSVIVYFEALAELKYVELMDPRQMITRARLVADVRALGVIRGMDLMVHSSLTQIGPVKGGAATVVEALLEAIGPRGTLLMPSFNHGAAHVFNPMTTPTNNGAIPDAMWRRKDALRSLHPTHSVAAIGSNADWYCAGHLESGIWAQDSPIGRLIHHGGHLLLLGVDHGSVTAYHVAEHAAGAKCVDPFGNVQRIVTAEGTVKEVGAMAWRDPGGCPAWPDAAGSAVEDRGLQRRGRIGLADSLLIRAFDLWRLHKGRLAKVCPGCRIRPKYDPR